MEYVEKNCVIEHEGRRFEAAGAYVSGDYAIGYPKPIINGWADLTDWHGNVIGRFHVLSTWRVPNSAYSNTMHSAEVFINGVRYVGRCAGSGMIFRGKRSSKKTRSLK